MGFQNRVSVGSGGPGSKVHQQLADSSNIHHNMDSFLSMVLFSHFTGGNGRCKAPKATFNSFWAVQNGRETSQSCSRHWFVKRNAFFSRMTLKPKKNVSAAPAGRKRKEEVFLKGKVPAYLLAILWVVLVRKKGACYNDAVVDFKKPFTLCDQTGRRWTR